MRKLKRVLSLVSATIMSGVCVLSNIIVSNAEISVNNNRHYRTGNLVEYDSEIKEEYSKLLNNAKNKELNLKANNSNNLEKSCDISKNEYSKFFPKIFNQGDIGSCTACASTYYQFTYTANKYNNIITRPSNSYSPTWTYNLINGGVDEGASLEKAYDALSKHGALTLAKKPYYTNPANYDYSWSANTSDMMKALETRVCSVSEHTIPSSGTAVSNNHDADLNEIKRLISDGNVLVVRTYEDENLSNWSFKNRKGNSKEQVAYRSSLSSVENNNKNDDSRRGGHVLTVVGYDDDVECDINGNKKSEEFEKGAFKVANSWGTDWKNGGYIWVAYDALNGETASQSKKWDSKEPGTRVSIFKRESSKPNVFYSITVKNYDLNLVGMLKLKAKHKHNFTVGLFRSDFEAILPSRNTFLNYKNKDTYRTFDGTLLFDYSDHANPMTMPLNDVCFGVKINNLDNTAKLEKVSYKIIDSKQNVVKEITNMPSVINAKENVIEQVKIKYTKGDINYDESIDTLDLSILTEYNLNNSNVDLSKLQYYLADYNNDNVVDLSDCQALSYYIATHSSRNELRKLFDLNQKIVDYMIDKNYKKTEISDMLKINETIQNRMSSLEDIDSMKQNHMTYEEDQ